MANNKMLIDASHPEETRVAVVKGNRIEEFDFESQAKKQLRGNIYLAKVTRVEPSLQAAFVDYGGNRHGFLAFSEIHPDYYQIPLADRQALIEEEAAQSDENGDSDEEEPRRRGRRGRRSKSSGTQAADDSQTSDEDDIDEPSDEDNKEEDVIEDNEQDDDIDEEGGSKSIAAAVDTDSISEPAPEQEDPADDTKDVQDNGENAVGEAGTDQDEEPAKKPRRRRSSKKKKDADIAGGDENTGTASDVGENENKPDAAAESDESAEKGRKKRGRKRSARKSSDNEQSDDNDTSARKSDNEDDAEDAVESVGLEDALEEVPFRRKPRRQYKIQEVVKRRQIMLVQVVKEERGNKGAALTTYLSLAGRYSVLMPNTARGGGISRKITNANDRKRLKAIANDLDVQPGMGVILRTAGASRTKAEIKRDFEYLMRLWENVRNLTLSSSAPCLVYEEGSLIKRSIRDLYNKDIGEILVSGEEGYREAKDFMRMLMPSHAKNVKAYGDEQAIFSKFGVEQQLDRLLSAQVTLKSGGYLVINQTEALVSIDVNSGRSTREHSIEDTALQTNLEAADEISRQLRLRDLAGLIVIDFIDMEEKRNNRAVEKRLKEALKNDRARIQVGRISHFGLLEMSRQRIRASVMESTMDVCPHCDGSGYVRSESSIALHVFRSIEDHLTRHSKNDVVVRCPTPIAIDILNAKRTGLFDLESRYGVKIVISADLSLPGQSFIIEKGDPAQGGARTAQPISPAIQDALASTDEGEISQAGKDREDDGEGRQSRKRRRRGNRQDERADDQQDDEIAAQAEGESDEEDDESRPKRKRRRGKRGGRRNRGERENRQSSDEQSEQEAEQHVPEKVSESAGDSVTSQAAEEKQPAPEPTAEENDDAGSESSQAGIEGERAQSKSGRATRRPRKTEQDDVEGSESSETAIRERDEHSGEEKGKQPKRSGWWSRGSGFF